MRQGLKIGTQKTKTNDQLESKSMKRVEEKIDLNKICLPLLIAIFTPCKRREREKKEKEKKEKKSPRDSSLTIN